MGIVKTLSTSQQLRWFAVYTRSRAEKKLHALLEQQHIESFLPLRKVLSQRSDRKKWVELPLLPSYLFVNITEREYYPVLNTPGAVHFVSFGGQAVAIPDDQIMGLYRFLTAKPEDVEVQQDYLKEGDKVEVRTGPLAGVKGEVVQIRGKQRLVLRFASLGQAVHVEISSSELLVAAHAII